VSGVSTTINTHTHADTKKQNKNNEYFIFFLIFWAIDYRQKQS